MGYDCKQAPEQLNIVALEAEKIWPKNLAAKLSYSAWYIGFVFLCRLCWIAYKIMQRYVARHNATRIKSTVAVAIAVRQRSMAQFLLRVPEILTWPGHTYFSSLKKHREQRSRKNLDSLLKVVLFCSTLGARRSTFGFPTCPTIYYSTHDLKSNCMEKYNKDDGERSTRSWHFYWTYHDPRILHNFRLLMSFWQSIHKVAQTALAHFCSR